MIEKIIVYLMGAVIFMWIFPKNDLHMSIGTLLAIFALSELMTNVFGERG